MEKEWNPRYVEYAKAHGRTPEEMTAIDAVDWPGGRMTGFICWVGARWADWYRATGFPPNAPKGDKEHVAFDAWLKGGI